MLYDVFICHASEDKDDIVRPLADALTKENIVVWYDEFELKPGDSLRESIDRGLAKSRHGLVVLSHAFFEKRWPQRELNGLVAREMRGEERVIIPLWHGVTRDDVADFSPPLADLYAVNTQRGLTTVCQSIVRTIRPQDSPLIVARDELIAFGLTPPVISDEWWLDVVEASNRVPAAGALIPERSCWGRWSFPLPNQGSRGEARGVRLAWSAMQLRWEKEAEERRITQITKPTIVLEFINDMPGLREVCHEFPVWLAAYAPQLTIPGLSGEFEKVFGDLVAAGSSADELILRSAPPRKIDAGSAACQFVQGAIFGPSPKFYEIFDYLVWLLSADSRWLPKPYRQLLRRGMQEWSQWAKPDPSHKGEDVFLEWLSGVKITADIARLPREAQRDLTRMIAASLAKTEVQGRAEQLTIEFLKGGYIEAFLKNKIDKPRTRRPKTG